MGIALWIVAGIIVLFAALFLALRLLVAWVFRADHLGIDKRSGG